MDGTTLSEDEMRQTASDLSSADLSVSVEARRRIMNILLPETIATLCQREETATVLHHLLLEVASNEVVDVHTVVGAALQRLFSDPAIGPTVVTDTRYTFIITFVVKTLCHDETSVAITAKGPVLAMMNTADRCGTEAATPWAIMSEHLHCAAVLRLFDCDALDSAEVKDVCRTLLAHTDLPQFIVDETCRLFNTDLLSLFNYLVVCGALSHHMALPEHFLQLVKDALESVTDSLLVSAACHFCGVALRGSDTYAQQFGLQWISLSLNALRDNRGAVEDAVFDVIGAASTTTAGWTAAIDSGVDSHIISGCLTSFSNALRCTGLHLLNALLASPFVDEAFFSEAVVQEAWSLRSNPEEPVRLEVWRVMTRVVEKETLRKNFVVVTASNLCGAGASDDSVAVRTAQLALAHKLLSLNALPSSIHQALTVRVERGLYPPGSAGVAAMTRD